MFCIHHKEIVGLVCAIDYKTVYLGYDYPIIFESRVLAESFVVWLNAWAGYGEELYVVVECV